MSNNKLIHDGIPNISEYKDLLESEYFKKIEKYSNSFIKSVGNKIQSYNNKWVPDPLHQWSRQWEYPYIINQANKLKAKNLKALDLGAGMTFLPYYLQESTSIKKVIALDYDSSLSDLYESVNKKLKKKVEFNFHDIRELNQSNDEKYDFIYSVSVLEHTDNYEEIISSCHKLLKKGGKLSITFDISLDGNDDIPLDKAKELLASIEKAFKTKNLLKLINQRDKIVTSSYVARNIDTKLMPWKYPIINIIKPILKSGHIGSKYKNLTFCCVTVEK